MAFYASGYQHDSDQLSAGWVCQFGYQHVTPRPRTQASLAKMNSSVFQPITDHLGVIMEFVEIAENIPNYAYLIMRFHEN